MNESNAKRFVDVTLKRAVELEKTLPQIWMRLSEELYLSGNGVWRVIASEIVAQYPQHERMLSRTDLAFRVAFRPNDNNTTLPGFGDRNINTNTIIFWYGMEYVPEVGDHIGLTRGAPWENYLLPDPNFFQPSKFQSLILVYDNQGDRLVLPNQITTERIPRQDFLIDYLQMVVNVGWLQVPNRQNWDALVFDRSVDELKDLLKRAGV